MKEIRINLTAENTFLEKLFAGDKVLITGIIYTARDRAHQLLIELLKNNKPLPFQLTNSIIYYTGPVLDRETGLFSSAGPTTSSRMDVLTPPLLEAGVKGFIGKGARSNSVRNLLVNYQAVYFSTVGGAGVFLAQRIKAMKIIAFPELHSEAIYELQVEDFPCYVTIDSKGNSLYKQC